MNLSKLVRVIAFCLMAATLLVYGEENQPYKPADIELFCQDGISQWATQHPNMKKLQTTAFWTDLQLSSQFIGLLSLGNRLEKELTLPISTPVINDLLNSPVEISLWNSFDKEKDTVFVIAMDIKPQCQSLVKLAEYYAKAMKKSQPITKNNREILQTKWLSNTLYHFSTPTQLVVANDLDALTFILNNSGKSGNVQAFRDSKFYRDYHKDEKGNLKCRINLMGLFENFRDPMEKTDMQMAVNMDLGSMIRFYSIYLTAEPGFKANSTCNLNSIKEFIPEDAAIAFTGLVPVEEYLSSIADMPIFTQPDDGDPVNIGKDIIPLFTEPFFGFIKDFKITDDDSVMKGVVGFSLTRLTPPQKKKLLGFLKLIFMPTSKDDKQNGMEIYSTKIKGGPVYSLKDQWLLIASDIENLKLCLDTYAGKRISIADSNEFKILNDDLSEKSYGQALINPANLIKAADDHFQYLAQKSREFNLADIKNKLQPVFAILSATPPFGVFMKLKKETLNGTIRFIDETK